MAYCKSKSTGKRVSCKRQRAGRKAARSRHGHGGLGKHKTVCTSKKTGKRVSCAAQRRGRKGGRARWGK